MRLLLDTHIAIWAILDDSRLSFTARELIEGSDNDIYVSAASVWEISIKHSLARGSVNDMPISGRQALSYFREAGYLLLNITVDHAAAVEELQRLHADPFDRLLIAQAFTEPLRLITHDKKIADYGDVAILV